MTEREQRELKTLLDRARIAHGRPLSNAETNSVKKEYIDKLMAQREAEAKKARREKQQAYKTDKEATFLVGEYADPRKTLTPFLFTSRLGETFAVASRAALIVAIFHLHHRALDAGVAALAFGLAFGFASEEEFSISLNRSISSSSVRSRHSPSGIPVRLTFIIRVRSSFVTS